jgi:hypothetical protein
VRLGAHDNDADKGSADRMRESVSEVQVGGNAGFSHFDGAAYWTLRHSKTFAYWIGSEAIVVNWLLKSENICPELFRDQYRGE